MLCGYKYCCRLGCVIDKNILWWHYCVIDKYNFVVVLTPPGCAYSQCLCCVATSRPVPGFRRNVKAILHACIRCFRRNAHYVLREMLVATNNAGTHNEYILVCICCKLSTLHRFYGRSANSILIIDASHIILLSAIVYTCLLYTSPSPRD